MFPTPLLVTLSLLTAHWRPIETPPSAAQCVSSFPNEECVEEAAGLVFSCTNRTQYCQYWAHIHWRNSCSTIGGHGDAWLQMDPQTNPHTYTLPNGAVFDWVDIFEWNQTSLASTYAHCTSPGWSPNSQQNSCSPGCTTYGIDILGNGGNSNAIQCGT